jgi:hypothetical protein
MGMNVKVFDAKDVEPWFERTEAFVGFVAQLVSRAT